MSEQFDNAMNLAKDAFRANNEEECKSFCNQALTVDPKSADAKALKGAAVLISFSLAGAEADAVEALEIWKSITGEVSMEYQILVIASADEFIHRWYDAAKEHHAKFKDVEGADKEWAHVQKCYGIFRRAVASLDAIEDGLTNFVVTAFNNHTPSQAYWCTETLAGKANNENAKKLFEVADKGLHAYNNKEKGCPSYSDLSFAKPLINRFINGSDDLALKAKEMKSIFDVAKKAHTKKVLITVGIIATVVIALFIIGSR